MALGTRQVQFQGKTELYLQRDRIEYQRTDYRLSLVFATLKYRKRFTNALRTSGQGEYTANAWAEKGTDLMTTTVRGIWKKEGDHYSMKHFENTSNGAQLLTTGILDLQNKTYKCIVRFLK